MLTSQKFKCLHPTSSRGKMCTPSISDVVYHFFSHGAAFYMLSGINGNVMLEYKYLSWVYGVDRKICHEGH